MAYLDTIASINSAILDCNETQEVINSGRKIFPHDQTHQLEYDRLQTELDRLIRQIRVVQITIASQN